MEHHSIISTLKPLDHRLLLAANYCSVEHFEILFANGGSIGWVGTFLGDRGNRGDRRNRVVVLYGIDWFFIGRDITRPEEISIGLESLVVRLDSGVVMILYFEVHMAEGYWIMLVRVR